MRWKRAGGSWGSAGSVTVSVTCESVSSQSVTVGWGGEESVRTASWGDVHSIRTDCSAAEPKMAVIRSDGGKWWSGGVRPALG